MLKFPSIGQFSATIKEVRRLFTEFGEPDSDGVITRNFNFPKIKYVGTPKLHGTNASIIQYANNRDKIVVQSRNRVIDIDDDNAGFASFAKIEVGEKKWLEFFEYFRKEFGIPDTSTLGIYGEWAGSNIQKGVALSQIPEKHFFIFAILDKQNLFEDEHQDSLWLDSRDMISIGKTKIHDRVHNVFNYVKYHIEIDFFKPTLSQNELAETTLQVEKECPIGKIFGISGVGEGVVWRPADYPYVNNSDLWFKVKGEEHSVSKVKTLASVDVEKVSSIDAFVDQVLTESRLNQGIDWLKEMKHPLTQKSTGEFLKWIVGDIVKEESETMKASSLDIKDVSKQLSNKARLWYFSKVDSLQ